ncbi:MAG: DUF47 family protein, partial [Zoogloea sp.]|nr:DUF47 family protein [Zoogloea sp.]
ITYTDVHLQRLLFFQQLFERWSMAWEDTRSRSDPSLEDGLYHMSIGRYTASSAAELDRFLAFLGSRLVFLIDWNRARKRLRLLLPKREAMALLKWAADNDLGHMAFLKAEATHLIFDALGFLSRGNLSLGTRLDDLLGSEPSCEYMQFVFRICSEGLAAGRPENFIQDEIRAELSNYFQSASQSLLDVAAEHAALSIEIACGIRDCLLHAGEATAAEQIALNARRAKHWEHEADELVNRARTTIRQNDRGAFFRSLVESADDIADELEEAAFHLTLIGPGASPRLLAPLGNLAGLLVAGSQEYLKALETAVGLRRGSPREDVQDFLAAVHRISANEQASDLVQREVKVALMGAQIDARQLYAFSECARNLEAAADALMHVGLALRDHVLGDVMAG